MNHYPRNVIRAAGTKSMFRHLWYFSERLVALAFFDDRVSNKTKESMAKNLQRNPTTTNLARLNGNDFDCTLGLENYVTRRSMCFFDLIEVNGQKKSKIIPVSTSINLADRQKLCRNEINCAWAESSNDTAERGVALIQAYSGSLTREEEQLQYLLQVVAVHRQAVPQPAKRYLTWLSSFNPSLVFRNLFLVLLIIAIAFAYWYILYPFRNFWSAFIFFWCAALSHNIYCNVRLSYLVGFLNKMDKTWM